MEEAQDNRQKKLPGRLKISAGSKWLPRRIFLLGGFFLFG
jgi:hypothetical protein